MASSVISDGTFKVLEKAMDISARRHRLITSNVANVDTIGYKSKDLDFQKTLQREMEKDSGGLSRTHPKHFKQGAEVELFSTMREEEESPYDAGSVNIDAEMTNLVENNMKYRTSVELLLRKMGILKHSITEGGR